MIIERAKDEAGHPVVALLIGQILRRCCGVVSGWSSNDAGWGE